VDEGNEFFKVDALDFLGRREEAFELAFNLAREGFLGNLFGLYNRAGRSQELVDYLEERWPGLDAFAADYPHDDNGYNLMSEVAFAYSRTGNKERSEDALALVATAMSSLADQGVDNFVYMIEKAKYLALAGRYDDAIAQLEEAVERGLRGNPALDTVQPIYAPLRDDPRFIRIQESIVEKVNIERAALDLDPLTAMTAL